MNVHTQVNVFCPNCHNEGNAGSPEQMMDAMMNDTETSDLAFRPRGQMEGYPVWICNKCNDGGVWVKPGWISKFKPLSKEGFEDLKSDWEAHHGEGTF